MKNKKSKTIHITPSSLEVASERIRALAHPLRMKILEFIDQQERGKIHVNKIYNTLKLEQSITSQHLRILRLAGMVKTQREGKFIYYSIDYEAVNQAKQSIEDFLLGKYAKSA